MFKATFKHGCWPRVKFHEDCAKCMQGFCIHIAKPTLYLTSPWMFALQNWKNTRCKCLHKEELKSFTMRKQCGGLLFILGYTYVKMTLLLNEIASATNNDTKMDTLITCLEKNILLYQWYSSKPRLMIWGKNIPYAKASSIC